MWTYDNNISQKIIKIREKEEMRNSFIDKLKRYGIELIKSDILVINECDTIEELDTCFDDRFKEKFLNDKKFKYELQEEREGIKIFNIGNGLLGYEYNGERFSEEYDLEEYIEGLNIGYSF